MKSVSGLMALVACVATSTIAQSASLVTNGSFEIPIAPSASYTNYTAGQDIGGWTVIGGGVGEAVSVVDGTFAQDGFNFIAQNGNQWLDLAGQDANMPNGVQQTISTVPGQTYQLSFWVNNVFDPNGFFKTSTTVNVTLNGLLFQTATNSSSSNPDAFWQNFVYDFVATGATTTLAFVNGDPADDYNSGLDNVSVTLVSETPVPAALPLFASVVIGGGALSWRKRRKQEAA